MPLFLKKISMVASLLFLLLGSLTIGSATGDQADDADAVCNMMEGGPPSKSLILGREASDSSVAIYEGGVTTDTPLLIYSASKLVTGVMFMRLVEKGIIGIHNKVSDYLPWWTTDESDPRSEVEMFHLLTQTSGFADSIPCVMDNTTTLEACSKVIYEGNYGNFSNLFGDHLHQDVDPSTVKPGQFFFYCESTFVLAGHIYSQVTNMTFDEIFFEEIVLPSGMSTNASFFATPFSMNPWPGGGLFTTGKEYSKFLQAYYSGTLLNETSMAFIETPHTLIMDATMDLASTTTVPHNSTTNWGKNGHYGIGCWIICDSEDCSDSGQQIMHSIGYGGVLPWVDRKNMYWGLIVDFNPDPSFPGQFTSVPLLGELLPEMEEFMNGFGDSGSSESTSSASWVELCEIDGHGNVTEDELEDDETGAVSKSGENENPSGAPNYFSCSDAWQMMMFTATIYLASVASSNMLN